MRKSVFAAYSTVWKYIQSCKTEEHLEVCCKLVDNFKMLFPDQSVYLTSLQMELQTQRIDIQYINAVGKEGVVRFVSRKSN